jgi:hypothetical protein
LSDDVYGDYTVLCMMRFKYKNRATIHGR